MGQFTRKYCEITNKLIYTPLIFFLIGASGREKQTDEECIENLLFEDPEFTSNARITSKVSRMCLESLNPSLQDYGSAICYNIATRDIRVSMNQGWH